MIIKSVDLETVIGITSEIPQNEYCEVAFAGKSNVGKSSLINGLLNRKSLARTSSQPGKTQTINFYNVNGNMYLVDLPGYGYAKASEEIKAKWGTMIENYLHESQQLQAVFLLIDIRHEPSENDQLMYEWMVEQGFAPIIIATKVDKIPRGKVNEHVRRIERVLRVMPDTLIIPFSAETKQGRDEIWEVVESLVYTEEQREEMKKIELERSSNSKKQVENPTKKARWKDTKNTTAKKTAKKQAKKKAERMEAAKKVTHQHHKEMHEEAMRQKEKEARKKARAKARRK